MKSITLLKIISIFKELSGENVSALKDKDGYFLFPSSKNGIEIKKSPDLKSRKEFEKLTILGQEEWPWAKGRITAGTVVDLRKNPTFLIM